LIKTHPLLGSADKINLIGFSQGGLISRYIIQECENVTVHNFLSVGSPQSGVRSLPDCPSSKFGCSFINYFGGIIGYVDILQRHIGPFGYHRMKNNEFTYDLYLRKSHYLPYINNEIDHPKKE